MRIIADSKTNSLKILKKAMSSKEREDFGKRGCVWRGEEKAAALAVIYLYLAEQEVIFLATLYKKSKRETLTDDEKQSLKEAARRIKAHFKLG